MIGLVLVTHGHLATEFRAALEHVVGPQQGLATIAIAPDDDMESRRRDIIAAVDSVESGDGVIVLTDMFGGTPSNLAISVMEPGRVDVVAGITSRAPKFVQRMGMEWSWRLLQEPRRMFKRYLVGNSKFVWLVVRARLNRD